MATRHLMRYPDPIVRSLRLKCRLTGPRGLSGPMLDYLVLRQIDLLIDVSRLTLRQEIIYRLYTGGLKRREIAIALGVGIERVALCLRAARYKLRAAYREGRYAGWYEVYLSEVRRRRKR